MSTPYKLIPYPGHGPGPCLDVGDDDECEQPAAYWMVRKDDPKACPLIQFCEHHARMAVDTGLADQPTD